MGEVIENNKGVYESSTDNLNEVDYTKIQMTNTLKELNLNTENSFYKVDSTNKKVSYDMNAVKSYLESIKDKSWKELTSKNTGAWIMAVQIALETLGKDVGAIDGVIGKPGKDSQTKRAIRAFQTENGLNPDGAPGKDTIKKILEKLNGLDIQTTVDDSANQENIDNGEKNEIPQALKDFREKRKENIYLDEDKKKAIIEAVDKIPHKATIESDGSRLVEFELGGKKYKCLDVNLKAHSDSEYLTSYEFNRQKNDEVTLGGMMGDDTSKRENRELAAYVEEQRNNRDMDIPRIEFQRDLINKLGETAGLTGESDKIAMWMYLTGNYGYYRLSMGDNKKSGSQDSRSRLECGGNLRSFNYRNSDNYDASLCMIACQ